MQAMNGSGALGIRRLCQLRRMRSSTGSALGDGSCRQSPPPRNRRKSRIRISPLVTRWRSATHSSCSTNNLTAGDRARRRSNMGTPTTTSNLLNAKQEIQLVNDGCPGETSASLIGDGPLLEKTLQSKRTPRGHRRSAVRVPLRPTGLPLHHEYGAGKSQLESAARNGRGSSRPPAHRSRRSRSTSAPTTSFTLISELEAEVTAQITRKGHRPRRSRRRTATSAANSKRTLHRASNNGSAKC